MSRRRYFEKLMFGLISAPAGGVLDVLGVTGVVEGEEVLGLLADEPAAGPCAMRCASCRCSWILPLAFCTAALNSGSLALAAMSWASFRSFWWSLTICSMYFLSNSAPEERSIIFISALSLRLTESGRETLLVLASACSSFSICE